MRVLLFYLRSRLIPWLLFSMALAGCHKNFLDAKPATSLSVPTTLGDFQALLDNTTVFNLVPTLGEASSDDYFFTNTYWQTLDIRQQNAFIWAQDIFEGQGGQLDWNTPYQQVFYANVVLDGLGSKPTADSVTQWNALEGEALFARAFAFYNVSQLFAPAYGTIPDSTHLGIPLRLHSEISSISTRSSLGQTYQQIINDLDSAEIFLPATSPNSYRNRPVRVAAQALLARVYLSMRNYTQAKSYADSALLAYDSLIDYNTLNDSTAVTAFGRLSSEVVYQASFLGSVQNSTTPYNCSIAGGFFSSTRIDSSLISSYDTNDLRRICFYHLKQGDSSYLKGSYTGLNYCFGGLAVDELYLIQAECAARAGDPATAITDINTLLAKRWRVGVFTGYPVGTAQQALDTVLLERRKELAFRGLRWTDLRRLNADGAGISPNRGAGGFPNAMLPSDPTSYLYTMPIPPDVIALSGMQQNPGRIPR